MAHVLRNLFHNPDQLFDVLDPSLREAMLSWRASFKKDVSHLVTQTELREKYKKIEDDNAIMRQFEQESTRQWQFPQEYIASAHPVSWYRRSSSRVAL